MLIVGRLFEFEIAHRLPYYSGICKNIHGHSMKLEIRVSGIIHKDLEDSECGMIIDFSKLKEIVEKKVIQKLDHSMLNDTVHNPTVENLVEWIWKQLEGDLFLENIKLWETSKCYAEKVREVGFL